MDLETMKRINDEFWAERMALDAADAERCNEADRKRDVVARQDALARIVGMTDADVQATFTDICEGERRG